MDPFFLIKTYELIFPTDEIVLKDVLTLKTHKYTISNWKKLVIAKTYVVMKHVRYS